MSVHVALLRSVNVGGHNRLRMAELRATLEELGATDVATYIQSGNVVFRGDDDVPWAARLASALQERHGLTVPVTLRSPDALATAADHPLLAEGFDPEVLHVSFLCVSPAVTTLDATRFAPDRALLRGDHVYLAFPNGLGRSKLTSAWMDRQLGVQGTVRNLGVVRALLALARAA